jgi:glycolate oxidase iron-sulfur subunit
MQTDLADFIRGTSEGDEADAILRKCVHCGFCTATCPTYQLLGDELDGPRGRIYLIKQVLEGTPATTKTLGHLDRCLTCRNCETTCPSGVRYGRLVEIGRHIVEEQVGAERPRRERFVRFLLREGLTRRVLFDPAIALGRAVRPLLGTALKEKIPQVRSTGTIPRRTHARRMILLSGCVQPALSPSINSATRRVFDALGIELVPAKRAGCCGALRHHLEDETGALAEMRQNIDAWIPLLDGGAEAIVINASGCAVQVKDYGLLLAGDALYAERARRVSDAARDLSEVLAAERSRADGVFRRLAQSAREEGRRVVFHPPCTLQHGQQIHGLVEDLLKSFGIDATLCADSHLCCGSAGTYSVLQPKLSHTLRENKLRALGATGAQLIVSANIGCLIHLQAGTSLPVRHWIELVDELIGHSGQTPNP